MSKEEIEEWKTAFKKFAPRLLKATLWSLIIGVIFLAAENFLSPYLFKFYPESKSLFNVFAWAIIVFAFLITFSEGTIYQYAFMIGRSFFLIIYFIYATNGGVLTVEASGFLQASNLNVRLDFVPMVVLLIFVSLITLVKSIVQAINFLTETSV